MYVKNSPDQWAEILEKFNSYDGSVTNFCEENKISKSQCWFFPELVDYLYFSNRITFDFRVSNLHLPYIILFITLILFILPSARPLL